VQYTKSAVITFLLLLSTEVCFSQTNVKAKPSPQKTNPTKPAASSISFPAIVAKVNNETISGKALGELVGRELQSIGNPEWKNLKPEYRKELVISNISSLVNSMLLFQKAKASGITVSDAEIQAEMNKVAGRFKSEAEMNAALASEKLDRATFRKNMFENMTISRYLKNTLNPNVTVTPAEVSKFYSANPKMFHHPDIVRTSHILFRPQGKKPEQDAVARKKAESILARVKKGEDFGKLAKENSMDGSAARGGDLGYNSQEGLVPEYSKAAFSLPVGGTTIVKSQYGYHIIKVTGKKKEGQSPLAEIKDELTQYLMGQKREKNLEELINQLRAKAKIEILVSE
jgi:parvulin-like peptidyl-prolyl isomerase